jgi:uncharacterized protein (DUF885 family)
MYAILLSFWMAMVDPAAALDALYAEHHAWRMKEFPHEAMSRGDYSNADRLADMSLEAVDRRHAQTQKFLERLRAIPAEGLSERALVSRELFERMLATEVEGHAFRMHLAPLGARWGPQTRVPQMHERVRFETAKDYEDYLSRLHGVPRMIDDLIATMRVGLAEGRTPPKVTLAGVPEQMRVLVEGQALEGLASPLLRFPASIEQPVRDGISRRLKDDALPAVRSAMRNLQAFLETEYLPGCRETIAAKDLPDGEAYYAFRLKEETTTDLLPMMIHRLGMREVKRIRREMLEVIEKTGFKSTHPEAAELQGDELFAAFVAFLRTDPRFYHRTEEDLLRGYRDVCKRIDAELPRVFRTLPRLPYGVRGVPKFMAPTQTTAYYQDGDIRNKEAGIFYANTYALDQRPTYEMIPLALHEAVPGHHLQIALARELESVPEFRRDAPFTAFVEGWALYAESLGVEMGLFTDPYDDFGRLLYEMWRACRLVVDTGLHSQDWSREQAIDFMKANTALSPLNIENEVDRYISWPGQATAYKIGELEIKRLRGMAETSLEGAFDLREFHDVILLEGAVPMNVMDRRVKAWIESKRGASDQASR